MDFIPSKTHDKINKKLFTPDLVTGRAMVNPFYPSFVAPETDTVCDSSAFQTNGSTRRRRRLEPSEALDRQLALEARNEEYVQRDFFYKRLVHYDQMLGVDEVMIDGKMVKMRGTVKSARPAILETLKSAEYYATQRHRIRGGLCFAAQGINPDQYVHECVEIMLDFMQPGDWLGFGGFCIAGRVPSLKPILISIIDAVIPVAMARGITHFHLLGVTVADVVRRAQELATKYDREYKKEHELEKQKEPCITISTDSSSIEVNSIMGKVWDERAGRWIKVWNKEHKYINYHPCDLALENIARYDRWCKSLRTEDSDSTAELKFKHRVFEWKRNQSAMNMFV